MKREVIIVRLTSGLGNQLFQYAAARSLALRLNYGLKFDASWYKVKWKRKARRRYELNRFCVKEAFATNQEIRIARGKTLSARIARHVLGQELVGTFRKVEGRDAYFDMQNLRTAQKIYLSGFWQSEIYFQDFADRIRAEFAFKAAPNDENRKWLDRIQGSDSVCIHVRRGDYVRDPQINRTHGVCSLEYYREAIARVREFASSPRFFVFSDDPEWIRDNLAIDGPTEYVRHNRDDGVEDFRLMVACRRFIIANSTFSWWAAWLADRSGKTVFAPSPWFADLSRHDRDPVLSGWIRLPAWSPETN